MRFHTRTIMLLLATFITFSAGAQEGIKFFNGTFEEALAEAKSQDKLLFVDFYATWCGPCKKMSTVTFKDKAVGEYFAQNFIAIKLDVEARQNMPLAMKYRIRGLPTTMFFSPEGEPVGTQIGYMDADDLLKFAKETNDKYKK